MIAGRDRLLVGALAEATGYQLSGYQQSAALALYCDLSKDGVPIGYISKGWDDPGFRIGELVEVSRNDTPAFRARAAAVLELSASHLVALGVRLEGGDMILDLTVPVYDGGLNARTFSAALEALSQCTAEIRALIWAAQGSHQ